MSSDAAPILLAGLVLAVSAILTLILPSESVFGSQVLKLLNFLQALTSTLGFSSDAAPILQARSVPAVSVF
jgi:hypothetical protein